jgi:hypothetical protein
VLDHRLPDAFEVGATKSDPSGDTPNNEPDVEIKRSAKRLTSFLGRMKPAR